MGAKPAATLKEAKRLLRKAEEIETKTRSTTAKVCFGRWTDDKINKELRTVRDAITEIAEWVRVTRENTQDPGIKSHAEKAAECAKRATAMLRRGEDAYVQRNS
jgi:hypothetical protein